MEWKSKVSKRERLKSLAALFQPCPSSQGKWIKDCWRTNESPRASTHIRKHSFIHSFGAARFRIPISWGRFPAIHTTSGQQFVVNSFEKPIVVQIAFGKESAIPPITIACIQSINRVWLVSLTGLPERMHDNREALSSSHGSYNPLSFFLCTFVVVVLVLLLFLSLSSNHFTGFLSFSPSSLWWGTPMDEIGWRSIHPHGEKDQEAGQ